jgi:hypothetical protein
VASPDWRNTWFPRPFIEISSNDRFCDDLVLIRRGSHLLIPEIPKI